MTTRPEPTRDLPLSSDPVTLTLPVPTPQRETRTGRYASLEPLDAEQHAGELYAASHNGPGTEAIWDYLPYGPFPSLDAHRDWLRASAASNDPLFFTIRDLATGKASGVASYLGIEPQHASIEIGHIMLGAPLQRTRAATEALYLLMDHALTDLRYRRLEWKCNALNSASRQAAVRLGFAYEGTFYQHRVAKGHNRDTAWFSILDREWPHLRPCFEAWLAPENFDEQGRQRTSLGDLTAAVRAAPPTG